MTEPSKRDLYDRLNDLEADDVGPSTSKRPGDLSSEEKDLLDDLFGGNNERGDEILKELHERHS